MVSTIADDPRQGCFQMAVGAAWGDSAAGAPITEPSPRLTRQGANGRRRTARRPSGHFGCRRRIMDSRGKGNRVPYFTFVPLFVIMTRGRVG